MRILFCNDRFPGHFEPLATYFARDPGNEVLFASRYERRDFSISGVRRVQFRSPKERTSARDPLIHDWAKAADLGRKALESFLVIQRIGFTPDLVLYSTGNGVSMFLERAFPSAFRAAYLDNTAHAFASSPDSRTIALMVQGLALFESHKAFAYSTKQRDAFPPILRPSISIIPLSVSTDYFSRQSSCPFFDRQAKGEPPREVVSFTIKSEPIDKNILRLIATLLMHRPSCHVVLLCGTAQNAHLIMHAFASLDAKTRSRLHVYDFLPREDYRNMLCSSSLHVCPEASGTLLVEHLEAMSCETVLLTPVLASSVALVPGVNMTDWPQKNQSQLTLLCRLLDDAPARSRISSQARLTVRQQFSQKNVLEHHAQELISAYREWKQK